MTPEALDRIEKLAQERLAAFKELYESEKAATKEALRLQAAEYERRLDTLNHAHQAALEAQAKTVPREMFEQNKTTTATALDVLAKDTATRIENVKTEEQTYRKRIDDKLAAIDVSIASNAARIVGGKDATGSIKAAIGFAILVGGFLLGYIIPLLRK